MVCGLIVAVMWKVLMVKLPMIRDGIFPLSSRRLTEWENKFAKDSRHYPVVHRNVMVKRLGEAE